MNPNLLFFTKDQNSHINRYALGHIPFLIVIVLRTHIWELTHDPSRTWGYSVDDIH